MSHLYVSWAIPQMSVDLAYAPVTVASLETYQCTDVGYYLATESTQHIRHLTLMFY